MYLPLLFVSILVNYFFSTIFNKNYSNSRKKRALILGIIFNLSLLGYFKYTNFLLENISYFTQFYLPNIYIILPLAISFFTFQQIAFLVDSYKNQSHEYSFINYVLFVSFFPQLIAGPIVHHKEMMPEFVDVKNKIVNYRNLLLGIFIFSIGLFKKVVIADTFAYFASEGFDNITVISTIDAWATSLSYTFQLYFDFSGYTDMAIGSALLFNIKLPINFNSPYKALDIQDFWRRWHITLSRFLRDYVYIPLGGNKKGNYRTYTNLFATFIIGGIWHGAGWTFVIWGALHGFAIVIHRLWQKTGIRLNQIFGWFITFNFVNIAWVFFRAKELEDALKIIKSMFVVESTTYSFNFSMIFVLLTIGFVLIFCKNSNQIIHKNILEKKSIYYLLPLLLAIGLIFLENKKVFLYYDF